MIHFSFQGEFAYYYTPYDGPWAKAGPLLPDGGDDPALQREQAGTPTKAGDYSLDGHYCNAAAAATALCRGGRTRTRRSRDLGGAGKQTRERDRA